MPVGCLLVNLGTPESCTVRSVRKYLREFLSDPRVISAPWPIRQALLYGVILPFRPYKVTEAYRAVWDTSRGSPLRYHSVDLQNALSQALGDSIRVRVAMRYGSPNWQDALDELLSMSLDKLIVIPLFPQYASATTGSVMEQVFQMLSRQTAIPSVECINDFFAEEGYIRALAASVQPYLSNSDHLLMSFHGLPVKELKAVEASVCDQSKPCPAIHAGNRSCYRAQCYATARAVSAQLGLAENEYSVSFQSRLGRLPWIEPYTDAYLSTLRDQGVERLAVACPSFTVDCLETLEEIGMQAAETWRELGGESLTLIPALNSQKVWVDALAQRIRHSA